jgi:hypothetical protein
MTKSQDGWLWSDDDECWMHAETLREALDAAYSQAVEEWDGDGDFDVYPAYRVNLAAAAVVAAERAIERMGDGTLETAYHESPDELRAIEAELARAFAADIERVCGPWYETLGGVGVTICVEDGRASIVSCDDRHAAEVAAWVDEIDRLIGG